MQKIILIVVIEIVTIITISYLLLTFGLPRNPLNWNDPVITPLTEDDVPADVATQITSMKQYLVDEFTPGSCVGMPRIITNKQPPSDPLNKIHLTGSTDDGDYVFEFKDGKCCTVTDYTVRVEENGAEFTHDVLQSTKESMPC